MREEKTEVGQKTREKDSRTEGGNRRWMSREEKGRAERER